MSTSFIELNNQGFWLSDQLLEDAAVFMSNVIKRDMKDSVWLGDYSKVLEYIVEVKPIGWTTLELNNYLTDNQRKREYEYLILKCIENLDTKDSVYVDIENTYLKELFVKLIEIIKGRGKLASD